MAQKKQIGAYFGLDFMTLVESTNSKLSAAQEIPFFLSPLQRIAGPQDQANPELVQLTASVQKALRDLNIQEPDVHFSLPVRDLIFRSFNIPFMTLQEAQSVVGFEARKYLPFKIDELSYTFHIIPITENQIKKNRILFLAIRKDIFSSYCKIFEQASATVVSAEPASLSLLRLLLLTKKNLPDQKIAIVQIDKNEGAITIFDKLVPQFIRDFRLNVNDNDRSLVEQTQDIIFQVVDEIRISFDFYRRQSMESAKDLSIKKIFIFTPLESEQLTSTITQETGIPTTMFNPVIDLADENFRNHHLLPSFSSSLYSSIRLGANLDLIKTESVSAAGLHIERFGDNPPNFSLTKKIFTVCVLIFGLIFGLAYFQNAPLTNQLTKLKEVEKKYASLDAQSITTMIDKTKEKNEKYLSIRYHSNIALVIKILPELLPEGVWLNTVNIKDEASTTPIPADKKKKLPSQLYIEIQGYAYAEQLNQQINLIETLLENIKTHDQLNQLIKKLDLDTVSRTEIESYPVTSFIISLIIEDLHV